MNLKRYISVFIIIVISAFTIQAEDAGSTFRRIAIYVGSNNGGPERVRLLYAGTDAMALHNVMGELGGVAQYDNYILFDPNVGEIKDTFSKVKNEFLGNSNLRTEFLFYYSGHSNEAGLLLGKENLSYVELKHMITEMGTDVNIAILDSCSSGVFTRLKGGTQRTPFLVDESVDTTGYAFLTSSSADEAAQESDSINASFFTHYFISALRGAGDSTKDGKVTLNEAFSFASNETLTNTSKSQGGVQHPSYNINLTGSGDLVLTDLRSVKAGIDLDAKLTGRIYVKDESGRLVVELFKEKGLPMEISLPKGSYTISLVNNNIVSEARIDLETDNKYSLYSHNFRYVPQNNTRVRGDVVPPEKNLVHVYGEIGVLTDNRFASSDRVLHDYSIVMIGNGHSLDGVQIGLLNFLNQDVEGVQLSAVFNMIQGENRGAQLAGTFNMSKGNKAYQGAGIFNMSEGPVDGVQTAGIFNIAIGEVKGVQAGGIFNIAGNQMRGLQAGGIFNIGDGSANGVQLAGIFNNNEGFYEGVQGSGIFNRSSGHNGIQMSLVNVTGDIDGLQFGLVNIGKDVNGVQVGLININDDIHGLPLGLINISRQRGLSHISMWQDSSGFTYFGYQVGARNIYTRIFGGEYSKSDTTELVTGVGIGYHIGLGRFYVEAETSVKQMNYGTKLTTTFQEAIAPSNPRSVFTGVSIGAGIEFLGSLAVFGGVTWDGELIGVSDAVPELLRTDNVFNTHIFNTGYSMKLYQKWFLGFRL